ncbi:ABC transporter ATP-binding protein [Agrobacterium sp. Ap1]|jgi:peptide/nickel transport system ATP-binding protein|uniref:Peptide/nickel transport system ATP-binding protein n=1 Tax=Rhizobium wenxiniae TaxID=1737357 RepID=A0A7W9YCH5_9HYPH|nr:MULTISPECIES: ABC transporter ATP-binding protein [Rhizobium/Agrobacterium group]MBB6166081.1 peptide/nickel transport system ATP-binding protein [Rhizobium wenxiniae]MBO0140181.1 ABC transporter ATP-binding protein [Agrobacterium sp. Ap1]GGG21252.1 ABC transporter ATP-binding protein [Rhizobium wenxiniae]
MLVDIQNLKIGFKSRTGFHQAVKGVSLKLGTEKLGIVGESGSGKSLTARALMKLLPTQTVIEADKLEFDGIDIRSASEKQMRTIRGKRAGFILQDPKYSLNPVKTVGSQVAEAWRTHKGGSKRAALEAAINLLEMVKIRDPKKVAASYPHEVSGGMGQRVMIAMMLAPDPELLIADEPTSALDATVQAEILRLIEELVSERGMGLLLISHDLPLVSHFCDRVAVMYAGHVMEELKASDLLSAQHPYTRGLLNCMPSLMHPKERLPVLTRDPEWLK